MIALLTDYTFQTVAMGAMVLGAVAGVLGVFAVLRQQSLVGDAISHAALPGICLGFLATGSRDLGPIALGALATGGLGALSVLGLVRATRLKTDAALGAVLSLYFAVGIVLLTYIQGQPNAAQAGLEGFLFGQAAALSRADLGLMAALAAVALGLLALGWKEVKLATFDPVFARTQGLPVLALEIGLTVLIAVAVVIGLQMVGVVLMAAMLIAPAVAARAWARRLESMALLAALFGMTAGLAGALVSAAGPQLATGPLIVLAATVIVAVSLALAPERGLVAAWLRRRAQRRRLDEREVLATLLRLGRDHADPDYPAEQGMVDAYHRLGTAGALARLSDHGMVARAAHRPGEGTHWVLTPRGRATAEDDEVRP